MYAKTGRENVPVQMEKMMHTHHVMQREQSNGLIGFRFFALSSLVNADLQDSVNPDKSTMNIVMAAISSRSMYAFIFCQDYPFDSDDLLPAGHVRESKPFAKFAIGLTIGVEKDESLVHR